MASAANVFRKAAVELLILQLAAVEKTAGIVLKCYRDYESGRNPSKTQEEIARAAETHQSVISKLESGKGIPKDSQLSEIMREVGLPIQEPFPRAFYNLLTCLRDEKKGIHGLRRHSP